MMKPLRLDFAPGWSLSVLPTPGAIAADGFPPAETSPDFWLQPTTLSYLAESPQGMSTALAVLRRDGTDESIRLTVQSFTFRADRQIERAAGVETSRRRKLLSSLPLRVLVIGQLLTSGDFGWSATDGVGDGTVTAPLITAAAETIREQMPGYHGILLKDLYREEDPAVRWLRQNGYTLLPTEPAMRLDVSPFATMQDYLTGLKSKYRVRYRRARSRMGRLERRRLTAEEVRREQESLYDLYREVTANAYVNFVELRSDYFAWLGQVGRVDGYYDAGRLVGFITAIANDGLYHAHYLGMQQSYKGSHHLYHNMLFDLIEDAIAGGYESLDYGRTALEIKSSVGAEPHYFATLATAKPDWLNKLLPHFVPVVFTPQPWRARHPFGK